MKRVLLPLLFTIVLAMQIKGNQAQTNEISRTSDDLPISRIEFLQDSSRQYSDQNLPESGFQKYDPETFGLIQNPSVYWVKFTLTNNEPFDCRYLLNFENWSYVKLIQNKDGASSVKETGHRMDYNDRDYPFANKSLILITLQENESKEYLARLEYTFNNEKKPANLNFTVSSKENLDTVNWHELQWTSVFIAVYLIMFFYNLFVFYSTRDRVYVYYLFMLLIMIYAAFYNSGFLVSFLRFIPGFPDILCVYIKHTLSPVLAISGIWFTQKFLNVKERYPRWNKFFNILNILLACLIITNFIAYDITLQLIGSLGMIGFITSLIVGIQSARAKYPSANYFVIGYTFFLVGLFIATLAILGKIPKTPFTFNYSMPIGLAIQMVFFSLALADKINILRKENLDKQQLIIDQLKENEALQTKVNRELEQKVAERTLEINKQKDQIEEQKDEIEKEMKKSEELLLNILPKKTAEELMQKGKATPLYYDQASVLFTDILSFTKIAEKLSPAELVIQLDEFFQAFDEIIVRHNLEKIKTIGDAYMCAGGIPEPDEKSQVEIVKAGLEIQEFVKGWNEHKKQKGEMPWELRIGIHTGPLIAGVVGKRKFAYDIWGDTVNIASRMESSCEPGRVNVSEFTWDLIKDHFSGTPRGGVVVKNKGEIGMHFVDAFTG
ncbi:MAG: hypothetical protein GC181_04060 [Bacteroidetes bacterium]|nr:hypothetical protein [Bacteroidota bacterium]